MIAIASSYLCTVSNKRSCSDTAIERTRAELPSDYKVFECHEHTVRATMRHWQAEGFGGLWKTPSWGQSDKWLEADMQ